MPRPRKREACAPAMVLGDSRRLPRLRSRAASRSRISSSVVTRIPASGALAAGGTLGILIPPSIVLVIYAILAEQNIAKLFAAALIPGILAALSYMLVIAIVVWMMDYLSARIREAIY